MLKPFSELEKKMSPEAIAKSDANVKMMIREMILKDIRYAHLLSQEQLAEILQTNQANISKIEKRTDMHVSTLREYIEAMGGKLDIMARFPEGDIKISQFNRLVKK